MGTVPHFGGNTLCFFMTGVYMKVLKRVTLEMYQLDHRCLFLLVVVVVLSDHYQILLLL